MPDAATDESTTRGGQSPAQTLVQDGRRPDSAGTSPCQHGFPTGSSQLRASVEPVFQVLRSLSFSWSEPIVSIVSRQENPAQRTPNE